ncbi:MAG: hypothetical protein ABSE08_04200 [Syntrophobacteraceae bacterium]
MLISVHIPKTAGTSFGYSLKEVLGDSLLLHYKTKPLSSDIRYKATLLECKFNCLCRGRGIERRYKAIHGHFVADTFNFLPSPKQYCVFLRRPVERLISHYFLSKKAHLRPRKNTIMDRVIRNQMTIYDFAALPEIVNTYSIFLGRITLEQFDFVGLQEDYDLSLRLFEKIFGIKVEERRENTANRDQYKAFIASVDLDKLRLTQTANQQIYDQARRRFDQLCSQYL